MVGKPQPVFLGMLLIPADALAFFIEGFRVGPEAQIFRDIEVLQPLPGSIPVAPYRITGSGCPLL